MPFIILVALILFGVLFCGFYIFFADHACPLEPERQASPLAHLIRDYGNYGESQRSRSGDYGRTNNQHDTHPAPTGRNLAQPDPEQQERRSQPTDEHGKPHRWIVKFFCEAKAADVALVFFTYGLMVVTGWLAWVTLRLWKATADAAERQARDTEILQRAYLSVEPGGVAPYASPTATFDPDWRVVAHIRIHNAGNLPARHVRYHFNTEFSTDPDWSEDRLAQIDWTQDYFAKSGETANAVGPVGNNIVPPASTMNQGGPTRFLQAKGWVYVWGKVTYHDGFVDGRETRFCHRYNLKRIESNKIGARRIRPKYGRHYERGNDAT